MTIRNDSGAMLLSSCFVPGMFFSSTSLARNPDDSSDAVGKQPARKAASTHPETEKKGQNEKGAGSEPNNERKTGSAEDLSGQTIQPEQTHENPKRELETGFVLIGGILILGTFLLAMTLLAGRRVKQNLAKGRTRSQVRDELWYLKNPVEEPADPDKPSDTEAPPE